ncbi:MAG: hypothetical protein GY774_09980 [Planctomycetes bacterium]|nr:hypothetical protein [Planctomycetota bacterium]
MYLKQRRDSRHWWRRIQSRKDRRIIIKSVQVVMVTIGIYLLVYLTIIGRNHLCLLAWCLIVGTILIPFMKNLRDTEFKEPPQAQQTSKRVTQPQEDRAASQRITKASTYRIKEIPSNSINTESKETESKETL